MLKKPIDCLWLWDDTSERNPCFSMGVDEALTDLAPYPVLRIYRWLLPCISVGYFTPLKSVGSARKPLPIIRRWTGGGIVTHGDDLPFSLIIPRRHDFGNLPPSDSYHAIHSALRDAILRQNPLLTDQLTFCRARSGIGSLSCFDNPVMHDLLFEGKKIAGGGQKRTRKGFLHQGSLNMMTRHHPAPMILASAMSDSVKIFNPTAELLHQAEVLGHKRYSSPEWTSKF